MASEGHLYNSTLSQFPQPARPFESPDTCSGSIMNGGEFSYRFAEPCDHNIPQYSSRAPEGEDTVEMDDDLLQILREFAEEFNGKGRKVLDKFFSKLEKNGPLDRGRIREKLEELRCEVPDLFEKLCRKLNPTSANHPVTTQRGVNSDSSSGDEQQELKLERFKVKTVNHDGGVVKVVKN